MNGIRRVLSNGMAWLGALILGGCRVQPEALRPDAGRLGLDPGAELGLEVEALDHFLAGRGLVGGIVLIALLAIVALTLRGLSAWLRRRGLDPEGRLTRVITLIWVGFAALVGYGIFLRLVHLAPVLTTAMLLVATTVLLVGNLGSIQSLIAGAGMALRGTVTPGLHVRIGAEEGVVDRTGPLTVGLRTSDGALILIPNNRFSTESVTVRNASRTAQVAIRYPWPHPIRPNDVDAARRLVLLCPYHQADLDVAIGQEGSEDRTLVLKFHTSSEDLASLARGWIYSALDDHILGPNAHPKTTP